MTKEQKLAAIANTCLLLGFILFLVLMAWIFGNKEPPKK